MQCATITVTDITQKPQNLMTLLSQGNQPGYTVVPAGGISGKTTGGGLAGDSALPATVGMIGSVSYLSIQASVTNSGGQTIYKGDENVATNGSCQGKELAAGTIDAIQGMERAVNLAEVYVTASANGAKFNVEWHYA